MSDGPVVEQISAARSDAELLAGTVKSLWGRRMALPRAMAMLRKLSRWNADQIAAALTAQFEDDPDAKDPDWRDVQRRLVTVNRAIVGFVRREDDADPLRLQLHANVQHCKDERREVPAWLAELLDVDARVAHAEAVRSWVELTVDPAGILWVLRGQWRRERNPEMHKVGMVRVRDKLRTLPVVGPETERQKLEWQARVAQEFDELQNVTATREAFEVAAAMAAEPEVNF